MSAEEFLGTTGVVRRPVDGTESERASRAWWDADAADYLAEQVLSRLPDHVRQLAQPAVLHLRCVRYGGHAGTDVETAYRTGAELRAEVSEIAHESFDAALVVKTLGREADETRRFAGSADELRDGLVAVGRVRGLFDPIMEALPNLGTLAVLLVGAGRVASGDTDAGDLVSIAYLFTLLALPIRAIGWVLADLPRAMAGFDRVTPVLAVRAAAGGRGTPGPPYLYR